MHQPGKDSDKAGAVIDYVTKVAAIDVGSNAMRIVVGAVDETSFLVEACKLREAVRLGADVFERGYLTEETIQLALQTFDKFRDLLNEHDVSHLRAVATSATREAENGEELIRRVRERTGIDVEVISGLEEAHLVYVGVARAVYLAGKNALIIDMGGGSVELTVVRNGAAVGWETLPIGPVRLLTQMKRQGRGEADLAEMLAPYRGAAASLIRAELGDEPLDLCVGTGGNIERMGKMRLPLLGKTKMGKIKKRDLDDFIPRVMCMSIDERREELKLRADRADIIVIAMLVARLVLEETGLSKMLVPGVGLREGLLWQVARQAVAPAWVRRTPEDLDEAAVTLWTQGGESHD